MNYQDFVTDIAYPVYREAFDYLAYCGNGDEEARFRDDVRSRMAAGEDELAAIARAIGTVIAAPRSMLPAQMEMIHRFRTLAFELEQALGDDMAADYLDSLSAVWPVAA